jgi:hypothetical protein
MTDPSKMTPQEKSTYINRQADAIVRDPSLTDIQKIKGVAQSLQAFVTLLESEMEDIKVLRDQMVDRILEMKRVLRDNGEEI